MSALSRLAGAGQRDISKLPIYVEIGQFNPLAMAPICAIFTGIGGGFFSNALPDLVPVCVFPVVAIVALS